MKKSRKKHTKINGGFIILPHYMTNSEPWKKCSTDACWVFVEMVKKRRNGTIMENSKLPIEKRDEIVLTYAEVKYKMGNKRFSNALKELFNNGFIEIKRKGGLYKRASIYVVSNGWQQLDPETNKEIKDKQKYASCFKSGAGNIVKEPPSHG